VPNIADEVVRFFLTYWVSAQNRKAFDDYERFYGDSFVGIDRAGEMERRLSLKDWLESRRRLFEKGSHLKLENVKVVTTSETAAAEFDQIWEPPLAGETSKKRLIIRRALDSSLQIVEEEIAPSE
jgi:hypothetical protein